MTRWYCKLDDNTAGPFSLDELEFLAERGQLARSTQVRFESESAWSPAADLLTDLFPPAVAPEPRAAAIVAAAPAPTAMLPIAATAAPLASEQPAAAARESREETTAQRRGKQVLLGSGIGMFTAAIIFLLLWLLLVFGTGVGTGGLAGGGGQGSGSGSGTGDGTGSGKGRGSGSGLGSGDGNGAGDSNSDTATQGPAQPGGSSSESSQGQTGESSGSAAGDEPPHQPAPRPQFAVQQFEAPPPPTASGGSDGGDGGFLNGGGGGSDGSEFFGTRARGSKFVYIIDSSGSMAGDKFDKAKAELVASLQRLKSHQSAYVFFFSDASYPMFSPHSREPKLLKCTPGNLQKMEQWILDFACTGGTEPRDAMLEALDLKPDAIFFLTDGEFEPGVTVDVAAKNQKRICINTICFVDASGEPLMRQIARENRGDYRFVP